MKVFLACVLIFLSYTKLAISSENISESILIQVQGPSLAKALEAATNEIPAGWVADENSRPLIQCPHQEEALQLLDCDFFSDEASYHVSLPLVRKEL
jgi:hypothetical protein